MSNKQVSSEKLGFIPSNVVIYIWNILRRKWKFLHFLQKITEDKNTFKKDIKEVNITFSDKKIVRNVLYFGQVLFYYFVIIYLAGEYSVL